MEIKYKECFTPGTIKAWGLQLLVDKLLGKSEFKGVSPVEAFCGMVDARN